MNMKLIPLLLLALTTPLLSSCGFQPLYGEKSGSQGVNGQLKDVFVANIGGGRFGQVLRQALQTNMASNGPENPDGYILKTVGGLSYAYTNIHGDNTAGHIQATGFAEWKLYKFGEKEKLIAHGATRALDGFDTTINEYFGQTLESEKMQERVARNMADQITQQVAIYFKKGISPAGISHEKRATYVDQDAPEQQGAEVQHAGADGVPDEATGRVSKSISTNTPQD